MRQAFSNAEAPEISLIHASGGISRAASRRTRTADDATFVVMVTPNAD